MRNTLFILTLLLFASFPSCKKAPLSIGETVTETRELPDFNEVILKDDISLSLMRSDTCYIEITTGKNIIDNIKTEVSGNTLTISNTNTLNWIRPYDFTLHATLYFKDITDFTFSSSGTLDTKNQYNADNVPTTYNILVYEGSGDIDMLLNNCTDFVVLYQHGTSHVNIHGENNNFVCFHARSYGNIDARDYESRNVLIKSNSPSDCYIYAKSSIKADITNMGNIYYKGEPDSISITYGDFAKGRLLPLN